MDIFLYFPSTLTGWVAAISLGAIGGMVLMSFVETVLHGYFMHARFLPEWMYRIVPFFERAVHEHRDLHHGTYYQHFDREDDPYGRNLNLKIHPLTAFIGIVGFAPAYALIAVWASSVPYLMLIVVVVLHMCVWNLIHTEMHIPRHPWWTKLRVYKFLARYHYLHHDAIRRHEGKNFNVVLPFWDFVLGSAVTHRAGTESELRRLGFLDVQDPY